MRFWVRSLPAAVSFAAAARTDSFLASSLVLGWGSALTSVLVGFAAAVGYIALAADVTLRNRWNVVFVVAFTGVALVAALYAAGFLLI